MDGTRRLSPDGRDVQRHLLMRPSAPLRAAPRRDAARVTIGFEEGIPVSVNDVTMGLRELIESRVSDRWSIRRWTVGGVTGAGRAAGRVSRIRRPRLGHAAPAARLAHVVDEPCRVTGAGEPRMTLWSGRFDTAPDPAAFDFGISFGFDRLLFEDDVTGSIAWAEALEAAGMLSPEDAAAIVAALKQILEEGRVTRNRSPDPTKTSTASSSGD